MTKKHMKLIFSIILDAVGFFTIIPLDFVWAPISGYLMTRMYKGSKVKIAGVISFIEEIIPFSNILPTFTLMWIYTYLIQKEKDISEEKDITTNI